MPRKTVLHFKERKCCTSVHLHVCLLILPEWLSWAVSSKVLFNITNLDCVCNKSSAKRGLFNEARNAAKFTILIPIRLMSAGKFPPCLVCWLGLIWVRELKICVWVGFADKFIALLCCARESVGKAQYRWDSSHLILGIFKPNNS